ncbi:MAG: hypothetical protein J7M08_06495 [Planctomycetes bacterium]|nr:hypothetical protein [Planctomycetota bacterium]
MLIEHFQSGRIIVDGRAYTSDVILWPEGVDDSWWRVENHQVCPEDLEPILNKNPDVVILGAGSSGAMTVAEEALSRLREFCAQVHVEKTESACALYNELAGGPDRVVAALHLSC